MQYRVPGHAKMRTVLGKNVVGWYGFPMNRLGGSAKRVCCWSEVSKAKYRSIFIPNALGVMIANANIRLCLPMGMKKYGRKQGLGAQLEYVSEIG